MQVLSQHGLTPGCHLVRAKPAANGVQESYVLSICIDITRPAYAHYMLKLGKPVYTCIHTLHTELGGSHGTHLRAHVCGSVRGGEEASLCPCFAPSFCYVKCACFLVPAWRNGMCWRRIGSNTCHVCPPLHVKCACFLVPAWRDGMCWWRIGSNACHVCPPLHVHHHANLQSLAAGASR